MKLLTDIGKGIFHLAKTEIERRERRRQLEQEAEKEQCLKEDLRLKLEPNELSSLEANISL